MLYLRATEYGSKDEERVNAMAKTQQQGDWYQQQRAYWDSWFDTARKNLDEQVKATGETQGQWGQFFSKWNESFAGAGLPGYEAYQNHFKQAGKTFMDMMEGFQTAAKENQPFDGAANDWAASMKKFYEASMNMMPDAGAFQTAGLKGFSADPFGVFPNMPGVGYSRERQEDLHKLFRLWANYETMSRKYNAEMAGVGLEAAAKFQEFLQNPGAAAEPLTSLKAVYGKWVDICEDIYAKFAMSDEYTALYGEVVNALMAYKKQANKLTDDLVEQMNLPTRAEVDSLHKKVQEMRRETAELKRILEGLVKKAPVAKAAAAKTPQPSRRKVKKAAVKNPKGRKK